MLTRLTELDSSIRFILAENVQTNSEAVLRVVRGHGAAARLSAAHDGVLLLKCATWCASAWPKE